MHNFMNRLALVHSNEFIERPFFFLACAFYEQFSAVELELHKLGRSFTIL